MWNGCAVSSGTGRAPTARSLSSCCWEELILEPRKAELFTHPFLAFRASHSPHGRDTVHQSMAHKGYLFYASWEQTLVSRSSSGCLISLQAEITPEWVGSMRVETRRRLRGEPRQLMSPWDRNKSPALIFECCMPSIWVSQQNWRCIFLLQGGSLSRKVPDAKIIWWNGKKWAIYWPGDAFVFNCCNFQLSQWI